MKYLANCTVLLVLMGSPLFAQSVQDLVKARNEYVDAERSFKMAEASFLKAKASYANTIEKSRNLVAPNALAVHERTLEGTSAASIEIVSAKYGYGTQVADVTQTIRRLYAQTHMISANGAQLRVPDPAFGKVKTMMVELRINGAKTVMVLPEGAELKF
ncbi:MAG: hypothetical protein R3C18_00130 [Planctomycetaceae bacterium]